MIELAKTFLSAALLILTAPASAGLFDADPMPGPSPAMAERLARGAQLGGPTESIAARGHVIAVNDASDGALLGSATRVCLPDAPLASARTYYLTDYHVVDSVTRLRSADGSPLAIALVDSQMDLALLWTAGPSASPCLPLADSLVAAEIYDLETYANDILFEVEIEAMDVRSGRIERRRLKTAVGALAQFGMGAHGFTGPLLAINAMGLRGMSGGAASAWMEENRLAYGEVAAPLANPTVRQTLLRQTERLLGLVKAVDADGRQTILLAAPIIAARLRAFFRDPARFGSRTTERSLGSSTELVDSGARLLSPSNLFNAGAGSTWPVGTARRGDGGTGRRSDGGAQFGFETGLAAGLLLPASPERLWLSIGTDWAEFQAVPPALRPALRPDRQGSEQVKGFYLDSRNLEGSRLQASGADAPIPKWLLTESFDRLSERQRMELTLQERYGPLFRGALAPRSPCRGYLSTERRSDEDRLYGALVFVCEEDTASGRRLSVSVVSARDSFPARTLLVELERSCPASGPATGACPASISARAFPLRRFPLRDQEAWLAHLKAVLDPLWAQGGARGIAGEALGAIGLRRFAGAGLAVFIEREGGYRIRIEDGRQTWFVNGPAPDLLASAPLVLSYPDLADQYVTSYPTAPGPTTPARPTVAKVPPPAARRATPSFAQTNERAAR